MLSLQSGQHDEIHHPVLVLRERAFGIVVFTNYFLCIGYNLLYGQLFETLVLFLQCFDGDGGGFFLVYLNIAKFGISLPYLYIGLYPAFFLLVPPLLGCSPSVSFQTSLRLLHTLSGW